MRTVLFWLLLATAARAQDVREFTRPTPAAQQERPPQRNVQVSPPPPPTQRGPGVNAEPPAGPRLATPAGDAAARALEFAQRYPVTRHAMREVRRAAAELPDPSLRAAVEAQLQSPGLPPQAWAYAHREEAEQKLKALQLLPADGKLQLPAGRGVFASAPGGPCPSGHHAFPGGLAVHSWLVAQHARSLAADYFDAYGVRLDDAWLVAAALWHDSAKAATLPWDAAGSCGSEPLLAGTPEHHVLGIAAALLRHLPAPLVLVIASAHAPPTPERLADVCKWIRAASILASGTDDLLACPSAADARKPPLEAFVVNLADADFTLTGTTGAWYSAHVPKGWDGFEALIQDGSDLAAWQRAQLR